MVRVITWTGEDFLMLGFLVLVCLFLAFCFGLNWWINGPPRRRKW